MLSEASVGVHVKRDDTGTYWACAHCATDFGPTSANYKEGCIREDHPVSDSNPLIGEPSRFIDDLIAFRQFFCPGCGVQIDNEIAVDRDDVLRDISVMI